MYLSFILLAEPIINQGGEGVGGGGGGPEYPEKTLGDELQKMPHTKEIQDPSEARICTTALVAG